MIKRKEKGFTLVELILVISIMSILFSYSFINLGGLNKLQNNIEAETFGNILVNFINTSRDYCREKKLGGYLHVDSERSIVTLNCGLEEIRSLPLPDKFTLKIGRKDTKLRINNRGIAESCTINFTDKEGKKHYLTICVGTAYVDFKD